MPDQSRPETPFEAPRYVPKESPVCPPMAPAKEPFPGYRGPASPAPSAVPGVEPPR